MRLPLRRIDAVIFDMDGLLCDTERLNRDVWLAVAPRFGLAMSEAHYLSMVGHPREQNDATLRALGGPGFDLNGYREHCRALIDVELHNGAPLKAGVLELLDILDARATPRAIATSSSHDDVLQNLAPHGLIPRFHAIRARSDYARGKPHPDPFLSAAGALGVAPEHCLALEDSHAGVRSAHAAGMMTVMAPDLLPATEEIAALCIAVVKSLHDVCDFVRSEST